MSIQSRTSRDQVTIERLGVTQSTTGGQIRAYNTSNRSSRPTTAKCRIQPLSHKERVAFGVRGSQAAWKLLFHADPEITIEDRVTFLDADGRPQTAVAIEPSRNLDGQGRLYRAVCEEVDNEL